MTYVDCRLLRAIHRDLSCGGGHHPGVSSPSDLLLLSSPCTAYRNWSLPEKLPTTRRSAHRQHLRHHGRSCIYVCLLCVTDSCAGRGHLHLQLPCVVLLASLAFRIRHPEAPLFPITAQLLVSEAFSRAAP